MPHSPPQYASDLDQYSEALIMSDNNSEDSSKVSFRYELAEVAKLAWPVALSLLFRIGMGLTDLAVLGHLGTNELAAAALANVWINVTSAFLYRGFAGALNPLCAQAYGAGNYRLVGLWLQQGLVASTIFSIPCALTWVYTENILIYAGVDNEVAHLAGVFSNYSILWLWPTVWYMCLKCYFESQKIVMPALWINGFFLIINLVLNIVFVYGIEGYWDGWGYKGSPLATAASRLGNLVVFYVYCVHYKKYHKKTWPGWTWAAFKAKRVSEYMCKQVLPLSIGALLEEWQLEVISLMAAKLGDAQIATNSVMTEVFFFLTCIMLGMVTATTIRIGAYLGAGKPLHAKMVSTVSFASSTVLAIFIGFLFFALRHNIGRLFSDDPIVWEYVSQLSTICGATYICLSIFYSAMATLDGQGRAAFVAISFFIGGWLVSVPLAYVFAFQLNLDLEGLWYALVVGYVTITCCVGYAAYTSDWDALAMLARKRCERTHSIRRRNHELQSQVSDDGDAYDDEYDNTDDTMEHSYHQFQDEDEYHSEHGGSTRYDDDRDAYSNQQGQARMYSNGHHSQRHSHTSFDSYLSADIDEHNASGNTSREFGQQQYRYPTRHQYNQQINHHGEGELPYDDVDYDDDSVLPTDISGFTQMTGDTSLNQSYQEPNSPSPGKYHRHHRGHHTQPSRARQYHNRRGVPQHMDQRMPNDSSNKTLLHTKHSYMSPSDEIPKYKFGIKSDLAPKDGQHYSNNDNEKENIYADVNGSVDIDSDISFDTAAGDTPPIEATADAE